MKLPQSLNTRLIVSVSALLAVFFGATTGALDYFFRDISMRTINDRLEIQSQALVAAVEEESGKLVPAKEQLDARLLAPNSGLYGEITDTQGNAMWYSPSLLGNKLTDSPKLRHSSQLLPGKKQMSNRHLDNGTRILVLSSGYLWEFADHQIETVTFSVAESEEPYFRQLHQFRWRLFGGFAVMAALLVVAMLWLLRTALKPLRQVESEILMIEQGALQQLGNNYPRELAGVTINMNKLLSNERERMTRYRNTLGNLAHSLKTPLAVIRNQLTQSVSQLDTSKLDEQVTLMDDIVRYQLKRAAASTGITLGVAAVDVREVIESLVDTLQKAYFDKHISCQFDVQSECHFSCDKNDFLEIIGNLLDNAFKYGRRQVKGIACGLPANERTASGIELIIEDDGAGIPVEQRQQVLQRGARLDEQQSGQGIGLSVVSELVTLYRGSVEIDQSSLGGARVTVRLFSA